MDAAVVNPGAILDHDTILLQSVNGTAHGPSLVLYTPAVSFTDCTGIVGGLRIEESEPDMKVNGHGITCSLYTPVLYSPNVLQLHQDCRIA